jgi:hypothetical protein
MPETIYPHGGHAVQLRPCPSWCIRTGHFMKGRRIDVDDGFHHEGPEIVVRTSDQQMLDGPETIVKVGISAWTIPLGAEHGRTDVDLMLATIGEQGARTIVKLTPGDARAIAAALLSRADMADSAHAGERRLNAAAE